MINLGSRKWMDPNANFLTLRDYDLVFVLRDSVAMRRLERLSL